MEALLTLIPVAIMGVGYSIKLHRAYKNEKKGIYAMIRKGLEDLDFDKVAEWANKLKQFDEKHTNLISGLPKKSFLQKIFRKNKVFKMDQTEKLFNLSKEIILDANKIKRALDGEKNQQKIKQVLTNIVEEEHKENLVLDELKIKLQKIKRKQIAQHNQTRTVIDNLNFTDTINDLHKEYEELFIQQFEKEKDLQNILQRSMKKQMLIKKMKNIQNKKSNPSNSC